MQMVIRILLALVVALLAAVLFAPKKELYYLLEQRLAQKGLVLSGEHLVEHPFGLEVDHPTLLLKGAELARIDRADLTTTLLKNSLKIRKLVPASGMERVLPVTLDEAEAHITLLQPRIVALRLRGSFGEASGRFDLGTRKLRLEIVKEGDLTPLRPYLKKENGRWVYEQQL